MLHKFSELRSKFMVATDLASFLCLGLVAFKFAMQRKCVCGKTLAHGEVVW